MWQSLIFQYAIRLLRPFHVLAMTFQHNRFEVVEQRIPFPGGERDFERGVRFLPMFEVENLQNAAFPFQVLSHFFPA
jgi:hypothetical protein